MILVAPLLLPFSLTFAFLFNAQLSLCPGDIQRRWSEGTENNESSTVTSRVEESVPGTAAAVAVAPCGLVTETQPASHHLLPGIIPAAAAQQHQRLSQVKSNNKGLLSSEIEFTRLRRLPKLIGLLK